MFNFIVCMNCTYLPTSMLVNVNAVAWVILAWVKKSWIILDLCLLAKPKKKQKKALSSPNSDGLSIRHCHGDDEQLDSQHLSPSKLHTRRFMPKRPALSKAGQRVRGSGTTSHCSQIAIWMSMLQAIHQQSQLLGANYCTVPQVPWWPELILSKSS